MNNQATPSTGTATPHLRVFWGVGSQEPDDPPPGAASAIQPDPLHKDVLVVDRSQSQPLSSRFAA
ncbi:MAG: hypothetical protein ABFC54_02485 [Thermoguttaceae bacterium]